MPEYNTLDTTVEGGILLTTINRPSTRNALDLSTQLELRRLLDSARDDPNVHGVVFTGHGNTFISGADIAQVRERDLLSGLQGELQKLLRDLQAFDKPTLASINGHALGGGLEFALACDIRIAATGARFGLPEVGLGILPGAGGTQRLARHVGIGRAVEMILTGRLLTAEEAQRIGLIADITTPDELRSRAFEIMSGILSKAPLALRLAKLITRSALDVDENTGLMIERMAQALLYTTDDKREGTTAFLERRQPNFTGK